MHCSLLHLNSLDFQFERRSWEQFGCSIWEKILGTIWLFNLREDPGNSLVVQFERRSWEQFGCSIWEKILGTVWLFNLREDPGNSLDVQFERRSWEQFGCSICEKILGTIIVCTFLFPLARLRRYASSPCNSESIYLLSLSAGLFVCGVLITIYNTVILVRRNFLFI